MNRYYLSATATVLALAAWLSLPETTRAQEAADGVEVLARGQVHEAYAGLTESRPTAAPIIPKAPPEPIAELPPDQKPEGDNVLWIPGYWAWDDERIDYIWISGFWRLPPPGRQWVPGHWVSVAGGSQWTAGFWQVAGQAQVEYLPPPPPPIEAAPSIPAPADTSIYVPGIWMYREARYVWRPGYWIAYRPNLIWIPAHYVWTSIGYVFVDGHWDYPLNARGILFAPVYIDPRVYVRVGWFHRPHFVVGFDFMIGSLFCRPSYGCYYFGDYFDVGYSRRGFTAWFDFRIGGHSHDPLYSYYRHTYAHDPHWDRDMRTLYVDRREGRAATPPRTLVQQNINIKNVTNVTNIKNVTVLTAINKVDPKVVKLQTVSREQQVREQQHTQQLQAAGKQRRDQETQMLAKGGAVTKTTDAPRTVKLDLPKSPPAHVGEAAKLPPPPPALRPTIKVDGTKPPVPPTPPVAPKKETITTTTPPPMPKKDNTTTTPPEKKKDPTPPPPEKKKDPTPPPPPAKKDPTPPPPPPEKKKDPTPPPPPTKKDPTPPPPLEKKKDPTPPPPPPPTKKDPTPPPPPPEKKKDSPPPEKKKEEKK